MAKRASSWLILALVGLAGGPACSRPKEGNPMAAEPQPGVTIIYHGHACFTIKDHQGFRVVIDPFDASVGYPVPAWEADVVLATHAHFDHANVQAVRCPHPPLLAVAGETRAGKLIVRGVKAPHWTSPAVKARGEVVIYRWEQDGIVLCHLGDLGQTLTADQVQALKPVDVLMVPVGGNYTIGPREAVTVIEQLAPAIVIPMHYKTIYTNLDIGTVGDFLKALPPQWEVKQEAGNYIFVSRQVIDELPARPRVWVINP
jgi:L-ascorbate metabolism protein UlaG (beta-lactamase superfamily)